MESLNMKPFTMEVITAKLFNELEEEIINNYGSDKGKELIKNGIINFGIKDTEIIAKSATSEGQNHNLFEYLPKQISTNENYKNKTPFARFSKLFAQITKVVVDEYGKDGEQVILDSVEAFGIKRGNGIAQRARANGYDNSVENYLNNYDMGRSELFEVDTVEKFDQNEVEQTFHFCPFGQEWKDDDMGEYGILYCHAIDPSIAKGYNSDFEVIHDQFVLKDGLCHFQFKMDEEKND